MGEGDETEKEREMGFCTDTSPVRRAGFQGLIGCRYQCSEEKASRRVSGDVVLVRGVFAVYLRFVSMVWR